jgi:hypothetical protein
MAMSEAQPQRSRPKKRPGRIRNEPPLIINERLQAHRIDPTMPLHRLAVERVRCGRDLKIIVTAEDSQTGVGKTTAAGFLALSWTKMFTGQQWFCNPESPEDGMATLNPKTYFDIIKKVGPDWRAGTTVIVDDAEELDARRAMQDLNVKFSQRWMLMRLKQAITIITLPSPSAVDSRLEELADVWINIERRGRGLVHDLRVENYGSRNVLTQQEHKMEFPDVSNHPELNKLRRMKEDKMDSWDEDEEGEDELSVREQALEAKRIYDSEDCSWTEVPDLSEQDQYLTLDYNGDYLRRKVKEVLPDA